MAICARCERNGRLYAFLRRHRHELFDEAFQAELAHSYRDDLTLTLISPSGTQVILSSDNGGDTALGVQPHRN